MPNRSRCIARVAAMCAAVCLIVFAPLRAAEKSNTEKPQAERPKRILLIGQGPDGHPWNTHEYMAGLRILASCLQPVKGVQVLIVKADEPWKRGPELLDSADGAVLFVSQGARWLQRDKRRLRAFQRLAKRGGGLVALHWGMGAKDAQYIDKFTALFGGIHGGPDRKYKVVTTSIQPVNTTHPVVRGVKPVKLKEEFYYRLKFTKTGGELTPLIKVPIDGKTQTVAFAWQRPDGGRSFCFSGGHFHANWKHETYRRLMTQAVLWSVDVPLPETLELTYAQKDLLRPRPKPER